MSRPPSRVDIICNLFQTTDMVTYEQAGEALALHPVDDRKAIATAMRGAGKKILAKNGRALRAVPDVGYRLAEANEHVTLYRERKRRGTVQLETGLEIISGTDLAGLSQEAKDAVLAEANAGKRIMDFIISTDRRQRKTEAAVEEIKGTVNRTAEETAKLRADFDRIQKGNAISG